jgi:hypothetical protein
LGRAEHPLFGFGGKKIHTIGRIILPVSFGTVSNARTEQIAFDVVNCMIHTMHSSEEEL